MPRRRRLRAHTTRCAGAPDAAFEKIWVLGGHGYQVDRPWQRARLAGGASAAGGAARRSRTPTRCRREQLAARWPATDVTRHAAGDPATVADEAACCATQAAERLHQLAARPPGRRGGQLLADGVDRPDDVVADARSAARAAAPACASGPRRVRCCTSGAAKADDAAQLTAKSATPFVDNTVVYAPHYFSTDGYAVLAVVNTTTGSGKTNLFPANFASDGAHVSWSFPAGAPFELLLAPAATLDAGNRIPSAHRAEPCRRALPSASAPRGGAGDRRTSSRRCTPSATAAIPSTP